MDCPFLNEVNEMRLKIDKLEKNIEYLRSEGKDNEKLISEYSGWCHDQAVKIANVLNVDLYSDYKNHDDLISKMIDLTLQEIIKARNSKFAMCEANSNDVLTEVRSLKIEFDLNKYNPYDTVDNYNDGYNTAIDDILQKLSEHFS